MFKYAMLLLSANLLISPMLYAQSPNVVDMKAVTKANLILNCEGEGGEKKTTKEQEKGK